MHTGTIVFIEIPVRDLARAADFYAGMFGWSFEETEPGTWYFTPFGRGTMGALTTTRPVVPGGPRIAVTVDDVSTATERAISLGGGPTGDRVRAKAGSWCELIDPDGNHLWIFEGRMTRHAAARRHKGMGESQ